MTMRQNQGPDAADGASLPPGDSFHLAQAGDGSVLLVMPGSDLVAGSRVRVVVEGGVLSVQQDAGGRTLTSVRAPLDADGRAFLACLPRLEIVEVYPGASEDENRFERFTPEAVSLVYEGRAGHG